MAPRKKVVNQLLALGMYAVLSAPLSLWAQSDVDPSIVGLAVHQETGRNIYLAALLSSEFGTTPENFVNSQGERVMEHRVVARRTSIRSLLGSTLLQGELASGAQPDANTAQFVDEIISEVEGSLYAGDSLTIRQLESGATIAELNGVQMASTNDTDVFTFFLMAWIGLEGPSAAFRSSIMDPSINQDLMTVYDASVPDEERLALVASWIEESPQPEEIAAPAAVAIAAAVKPAAPKPELPAAESEEPVVVAQVAEDESTSVESPSVEEQAAPEMTEEPVQMASVQAFEQDGMDMGDVGADIDAIDVAEYSQRLGEFNTSIIKQVYSEIRYPRSAVRRGIQGTLELDVTMNSKGQLVSVEVAQTSGYKMLDNSALSAANSALAEIGSERLDPVAIAEYGVGEGQIIVPVPVSFVLQ
jgi:TonB family protein